MTEADPFFERVRSYVEPDYEVSDPGAKVTAEQLRAFFDRCIELHSPAELDTSYLEDRELLEEMFGEKLDDAIVYMTGLNSADAYQVFGRYVDLDSYEAIDRPEKKIELKTHRFVESLLGPILTVVELRDYVVELDLNSGLLTDNFREKSRILDKEKLDVILQLAKSVLNEPLPEPKRETLVEMMQRSWENRQVFTQGRWVEAMLLLDMIALLKDLGITSTDELNW